MLQPGVIFRTPLSSPVRDTSASALEDVYYDEDVENTPPPGSEEYKRKKREGKRAMSMGSSGSSAMDRQDRAAKKVKTIKVWNNNNKPADGSEDLPVLEVEEDKIALCAKDPSQIDTVLCRRKVMKKKQLISPAICRICEVLGIQDRDMISGQSSSTALRDHLHKQHSECIGKDPRLKEALAVHVTRKSRVTLEVNKQCGGRSSSKVMQGPISKFFSFSSVGKAHVQNVINFKKVLPIWTALDGVPFSAFESPIAKYAISLLAG
eukprot:Nk52_evm1s2497 gene=Nk52_evmTU1s2497